MFLLLSLRLRGWERFNLGRGRGHSSFVIRPTIFVQLDLFYLNSLDYGNLQTGGIDVYKQRRSNANVDISQIFHGNLALLSSENSRTIANGSRTWLFGIVGSALNFGHKMIDDRIGGMVSYLMAISTYPSIHVGSINAI